MFKSQHNAIACPLCDYTTGISKWSQWGEQNARGALVSHLCRKKHGMTRAEANKKARQALVVVMVWDDVSGEFRKQPQSADAVARAVD